MPRRHRRLGLRSRVTAAFALGALVLSVSLSTLTYFTARQYFLHERQTAVLRQAYVNANLVRAALRSPQPDIPPLLASLDTAPGSRSVLYDRGRWFATSLTVGRDALPAHLRGQVTGGTPASQRFNLAGSLQMGVGIPIPVDRKSTRLNSSHRCISYAVFCLKKKKQKKKYIQRTICYNAIHHT